MKTIGLLGGVAWPSTITYYKLLNEKVSTHLGDYHSAKIILSSIDHHDIMLNYGKNHEATAALVQKELQTLIDLKPDCIIICCNSLHKYYDMISSSLDSSIPVFHALHLVAQEATKNKYRKVLLLATKFAMEDGFFTQILEQYGITPVIPNQEERDEISRIHSTQLMHNIITPEAKEYFSLVIKKYKDCDAVILGCTEYPLLVDHNTTQLPILNAIELQTTAAVMFALDRHENK